MDSVKLTVYSDYLCPWCYNASVRLKRVAGRYAGQVELDFRSYLLRPEPRPDRSLERFVRYTRSWQRPAAEPDSGEFRVWDSEAGPPSHSVPPHLVAKAAARIDSGAFDRIHDALLQAYFALNRDITDDATLRDLWAQCGLAAERFDDRDDPALLDLVLAEHRQAIEQDISGVPTVIATHQGVPLTGAQPLVGYERWVGRMLRGEI